MCWKQKEVNGQQLFLYDEIITCTFCEWKCIFPPKNHVLQKVWQPPLPWRRRGGQQRQQRWGRVSYSPIKDLDFTICGAILCLVFDFVLSSPFSMRFCFLPCILNLMCFILSDSRMHNFSLEVWLSKETCHYHLCFVPGALDWVLCLEENYTQHCFDWSHVNVIMEIWNLFLQHFSAFPFVLQVSVLFLNTGPNLSVSVFYFIVNYECSIRELEEKMRTSLYALLETRNASSTPELFWIG